MLRNIRRIDRRRDSSLKIDLFLAFLPSLPPFFGSSFLAHTSFLYPSIRTPSASIKGFDVYLRRLLDRSVHPTDPRFLRDVSDSYRLLRRARSSISSTAAAILQSLSPLCRFRQFSTFSSLASPFSGMRLQGSLRAQCTQRAHVFSVFRRLRLLGG